ncbi:MAG: DUF5320 domain-containing protein [Tissierellia bacterium]|nr:DUF5320 domain-containing protein [Tissierellia bacterium]
MPGRDGRGPVGRGPATGRGLGVCGYGRGKGYGYGYGRHCYGLAFRGRGFNRIGDGEESRKELLEKQKEFFKSQIELIEKELEE